jgi:hypothetical protein
MQRSHAKHRPALGQSGLLINSSVPIRSPNEPIGRIYYGYTVRCLMNYLFITYIGQLFNIGKPNMAHFPFRLIQASTITIHK